MPLTDGCVHLILPFFTPSLDVPEAAKAMRLQITATAPARGRRDQDVRDA